MSDVVHAVRRAVGWSLVALVAGGYAASQSSVWRGQAVEWHARMDMPPVRLAAALLLVSALVLAFLPASGADDDAAAGTVAGTAPPDGEGDRP